VSSTLLSIAIPIMVVLVISTAHLAIMMKTPLLPHSSCCVNAAVLRSLLRGVSTQLALRAVRAGASTRRRNMLLPALPAAQLQDAAQRLDHALVSTL
jgi:hypothetical protein